MTRKVISLESLGVALGEAHRQQRLSQAEAGRPVGLDQPTVSRVEQGSPGTRLDTLFRLLAAIIEAMMARLDEVIAQIVARLPATFPAAVAEPVFAGMRQAREQMTRSK
ncbi:hypothetical protein C2E25_14645 [Geothermobacter hydrogeniphilus]|uniref:Helix-turn-helix n=1 Tax=Geothermobacter hydrogeniphilus TaxID=1969733 RepID=A0A2K2H6V5_9BACT|nr:helix-turn-helix domain-containing protein [Geothermobacter hydrogeniphilus]PNU19042.1 hypothetical protein C2E25_14645 [Geothermobacter hydrogeniphilus]